MYVCGMEILYLGHASFKLKGKNASLITDPFGEMCGKFPKDAACDLVTVSHAHEDHNAVDKIADYKNSFIIDGPGEYEVKGISVIGISSDHDEKSGQERGKNTLYVIEMDGLRLAHLGDLGHKLTTEQLAEMGSVDILFIPVGGFYTINAKIAAEVVKQVDPWVAIPMHYQQPGLDPKVFKDLADVSVFLKEMEKSDVAAVAKYSVTADRMPTELQVVVMERK